MIDEINSIIEKNNGIWGSTYIKYSELGNRYTSAIVVAEPYGDFISIDNYEEQKYNQRLKNLRMKINITKQFGPRVGLGVILVDYDFKMKEELVKNLCGNCTRYIEACPWGTK